MARVGTDYSLMPPADTEWVNSSTMFHRVVSLTQSEALEKCDTIAPLPRPFPITVPKRSTLRQKNSRRDSTSSTSSNTSTEPLLSPTNGAEVPPKINFPSKVRFTRSEQHNDFSNFPSRPGILRQQSSNLSITSSDPLLSPSSDTNSSESSPSEFKYTRQVSITVHTSAGNENGNSCGVNELTCSRTLSMSFCVITDL